MDWAAAILITLAGIGAIGAIACVFAAFSAFDLAQRMRGDDNDEEATAMPAINFKKQFAPDVESGKKTRTIRRKGKRNPPEVNQHLRLYTGQRTTQCRLIGVGNVTGVQPIKIYPDRGEILLWMDNYWQVLDSPKAIMHFAQMDGFEDEAEFFEFFDQQADEKGIFEGHVIEWDLLSGGAKQ